MKILLVDDEREEREGISFLIRKFRYPLEIVQAASGKEALAVLEKEKIDILFTDVKMPVMSGLELARTVRETDKDIKIIIFSAYAEFEYAKQAIEMNALRYLLKPIEIDEFKELMDDVISSLEETHLAPAYVSYIFKQETGQSLVKYVTDVKMAKARRFLEDKDMKIVQVGKACGYENQSYFNRLFKNYHGVTPKQYREQL